MKKTSILLFLSFLACSLPTWCQKTATKTREYVVRVSPSKEDILIITNNNQRMALGDFITFAQDGKYLARAVVALENNPSKRERKKIQKITQVKKTNFLLGVKVLKWYSRRAKNHLTPGRLVDIIIGPLAENPLPSANERSRGKKRDDVSSFSQEKIQELEDLFRQGDRQNNFELREGRKRAIHANNLMGINFDFYRGIDRHDDNKYHMQFSLNYSYQVIDNLWLGTRVGFSPLKNFPNDGLNTQLYTVSLRVKYAFKIPLNFCIMPYIGILYSYGISKDAGEQDANNSIAQNILDQEKNLLEKTRRFEPDLGVDIYKRMLPGWFLNFTLGWKALGAGVRVEF